MRLGGAAFRPAISRSVVGPAAIAGVLALLVAAGPAAAVPHPSHLWAITRDAHGHLSVVRGDDAASTVMDSQSGHLSSEQVLSYEEDAPVHALGDPLRPQQWALDAVPYESSWAVTRGNGVKVAVVDTGVLGDHEDLAGSVIPGKDYVGNTDGRIDPGGHGTHVAGIIAAHVNNGVGIAGAAPGVQIMPVRVLDGKGQGSTSNVALGIIWAVDHGARVINLSLGGGPSPGIETAMQYANSKNAVVIAAGGNNYESGNEPVYPAVYPEAIAVAAVDKTLHHASFSNTGNYIDIAAPGDLIWSTWGSGPTQYALASGTSMATPYVSAAAALVVAENPKYTAAQIRNALESTATDLGAPGRDPVYGYGLVNPYKAVVHSMPGMLNRGTKGNGYWIVTADGQVHGYGRVRTYGDMHGKHMNAPIVAAARTKSGHGYWLCAADGAVYTFGDAQYHGGMGGRHLNSPIVAMAATPDGRGYILLGRDGGIFTFGDASYHGSTGGRRLNAPVLDLTMTADGRGYWFVAADGGVFSFGDAVFHGSTGNIHLAAPVKSMTAAAGGKGYWMVADDGGIFAFHAPFEGSLPGIRKLLGMPYLPSIRMRNIPTNDGYYILELNGTVYGFGNARYYGSLPGVWAVDLMPAP
jgi:type VII secretion-associated serine protease mycosin